MKINNSYIKSKKHFKNILETNKYHINVLEDCIIKIYDYLPEKEKEKFMNKIGFAYFGIIGSYDFIIRRLMQYPDETKQLIEKYDRRNQWYYKIN